mgnify:CR=1 FL=1
MKKFEENDRYYKKITEEILWEFPFYNYEYDILPYIQRIEPIGRPKQFRKLICRMHRRSTQRYYET